MKSLKIFKKHRKSRNSTSIIGICQALVFVSGMLYCYEIIDVTIGKGENLHLKWLGPYFVTSVSPKGVAMLKNRNGKILLKKYNIAQLKPYVDCEGFKSVGEDSRETSQTKVNAEENEHEVFIEKEKPNGDISDKTVDEDVTENSLNVWDMLPDEIIEKIVLDAIKRSADKCQTYMSILNTCSRFKRFQEKGKLLLPQIYIKPDDYIQQCSAYDGKKV